MTPTRSCLVALAGLALLATQSFGQYNAPCGSMPFNGMIPAKPIPPVAPIPGGDPRAALFGGNAGQAGCGCTAGPASCGCMAGPAPAMVPPGRGPMPYQAGLWQPDGLPYAYVPAMDGAAHAGAAPEIVPVQNQAGPSTPPMPPPPGYYGPPPGSTYYYGPPNPGAYGYRPGYPVIQGYVMPPQQPVRGPDMRLYYTIPSSPGGFLYGTPYIYATQQPPPVGVAPPGNPGGYPGPIGPPGFSFGPSNIPNRYGAGYGAGGMPGAYGPGYGGPAAGFGAPFGPGNPGAGVGGEQRNPPNPALRPYGSPYGPSGGNWYQQPAEPGQRPPNPALGWYGSPFGPEARYGPPANIYGQGNNGLSQGYTYNSGTGTGNKEGAAGKESFPVHPCARSPRDFFMFGEEH